MLRSALGLTCLILLSSRLPSQEQNRGVEVQTAEAEPAHAGYARRHALVIGIDDYEHSGYPDLSYAAADARAFAETLTEQFQFERVRLILDEEATQSALLAALEEWAADPLEVGPQDLVVLFYAGHGVNRELPDGSCRGYLVPVDARQDSKGRDRFGSLVGMNQIEETSRLIPAKHAVFVVDCCFGGLATTRAKPPLAAGMSSRARQVLTAGDREQVVLDGGGGGHSVFTSALLRGLRGAADTDTDEVVTFGELFDFVNKQVQFQTEARQIPLQATLQDHEGGSVAFFKPGAQPTTMTAAERLRQMERTAEERLVELEGYSDGLLVQDLIERADQLWPRRPERIKDYRRWLGESGSLVARRADHESNLTHIREEAFLSQVVAGVPAEEVGEPDWSRLDPRLAWRFRTTRELLEGLSELDRCIADVSDRLAFAGSIAQRSIGDHQAEWDEAIDEIPLGDAYDGLEITPQIGLVPIGPDPTSGLWEFWHLESGDRPERNVESGQLEITGETGIVLVLIPGGTFWMGTQSDQPQGQNHDPYRRDDEGPVHEVELAPYFLSKYEVTQAQWQRLAGTNPSYWVKAAWVSDAAPRHPVEQVSYTDCDRVLPRYDLALPTEAQWEFAARAGTASVWWTGSRMESLNGVANLADQQYSTTFPDVRSFETWLDDGYPFTAPVGSYRANPFGLHDVFGNVWEWCRDRAVSYRHPARPGDGLRTPPSMDGAPEYVIRGGCFSDSASICRAGERANQIPEFRHSYLGVRPARVLR